MLFYLLRPFIKVMLQLLFWWGGGIRVEGTEHVPARGAVIIAPNHLSFAAPLLMGVATRRYVWFMATDELFEMPVLGRLARIMRAYPIRQDSPDRSALKKTIKLLRAGEAVVIFPEGHVSKDGRMQQVQPGTILLAAQTGASILPVGVAGTDAFMPPHQWGIRRAGRRMVVRFGEPVSASELMEGLKGRAGVDQAAERLGERIAALAGQPAPPAGAAEGDSERDSEKPDSSVSCGASDTAQGRNCRL